MYAEYKEQDIYKAIKSGFANLRVLVRKDLRARWKMLNLAQRYSAGRGLVQIGAIADAPQKHFSRAETEVAWLKRANDYVKEKNIAPQDAKCAFLIVPAPVDVAMAKMEKATFGSMWREVYAFSRLVQMWEYERTNTSNGNHHAAACAIKQAAREYQELADIERSGPIMRQVRNMKRQILR